MVWKEVLARGTPPLIRWSLTEDLLEEGLGVILGDLPGCQECEALDGHVLGECHCIRLGDVVLGQGLESESVTERDVGGSSLLTDLLGVEGTSIMVVSRRGLLTSMVSIMAKRNALTSWHRRSC